MGVRIQVEGLIGHGAFADVYRALDFEGGETPRPVALKVLREMSPEAFSSFQQEARFLTQLKHPGLVPLHGFSLDGRDVVGNFGEASGRPCFWMELVEGRPLLDVAAGRSPERIVGWLLEILEALDYIHGQGVLHGDLKPSNILVDAHDRARLLDFGLSHFRDPAGSDGRKRFRGTLLYAAPETISGRRSPAGDLYSLGLVFHEALTGRHPRGNARSLQELFSASGRRLADSKLPLPGSVKRTLDRLIETDPAERPATASETLRALQDLSEAPVKNAASLSLHSLKLFGRDREMRQALDFLSLRRERRESALLLIHGPTGAGKSRFARELAFELTLQDWNVDLRREAENLTGPQAAQIHRRMDSASEGSGEGGSAILLEFTDERAGPAQTHFFRELARDGRVLDLALGPLSPQDAADFIAAVLKREIPRQGLEELYRRTQGLPELMVRTLRRLVADGLLGKRHIHLRDLQTSLPRDFENLFRQRLQGLDDLSCRILNLVALARRPVTPAEIAAAAGLPFPEIAAGLIPLAEEGLVETLNDEGDRVRAGHPALSNLVLEFLSPEEARSFHEAWIAHWRSRREVFPDAVIDLAFHALALPTHPETAAWNLEAGEILKSRGGGEEERMIPAYEACLKRNLRPGERDALLRALANACGRKGDFRKSLDWMEEWFSEFGGGRRKDRGVLPLLKYWLASAVACKNLGDPNEAARRFRKCLESGDPEDPVHRPRLARAHSLLGLAAIEENKFEEARRHLEEARRLVPAGGLQEAEALKSQAVLAFAEHREEEGRALLRRSEEIYESSQDARGRFEIEIERGNLAIAAGDRKAAEESYAAAARIAAAAGREALLARVGQNRGVLAGRAGDLARALEELEKARDLYVFFGDLPDKAQNLLQLALAYAWLGRFGPADRLLREARDLGSDPSLRLIPEFKAREREVVFEIEALHRGEAPRTIENPFRFEGPSAPWDLEHLWLRAMIDGVDKNPEAIRAPLTEIHRRLPPSLRPAFEERPDYQRFVQAAAGPPDNDKENAMESQILDRIQSITSQLLNAGGLDQTLVRVLDTAMELSRAQRGFLLLQGGAPDSPIPGFRVVAVRNISRNALAEEDLRVSLSALTEALRSGKPVVADNALEDQRFRDAPSVIDMEIRSVLILPILAEAVPVGALYLDHTYETEIFGGQAAKVLEVFAGQAGLALQKARLIDELKRANAELTETVSDQSTEIVALKKEVEEQRLQLAHEYAEIVGQSPKMLETLQLVDRLIDVSLPVWIFGESGTGKEAIARALHFKGPRAKKQFVSENCSSLPEALLESELFGHKKGSFTHADRDKKGLLAHADGGTVFLDEVADMSAALQAKLLRFLQEGEIRPVGSNETIKVDVRVVSASNKDLNRLVGEGKFREDLFYRLNGMTVSLPALRDRIEDIPLLIQHFLKRQAAVEKKAPIEITRPALELLTDYEWPGNVRELENTLRSASLFHVHGKLLPKSFHFKKALFQRPSTAASPSEAKSPSLKKGHLDPGFDEKAAILKALKENRCHKGLAADALGISRRYLYTKLAQHGIPLKRTALRRFVEKEMKVKA